MPRWVLRGLHLLGWLFLAVGVTGFIGHVLEPEQAGTPELGDYGGWILDGTSILLGVGALLLRRWLVAHAAPSRLESEKAATFGAGSPPDAETRGTSLAAWVRRTADRLFARSDWGRYRPPTRVVVALACWLTAPVTLVGMGLVLNVPAAAWIIFTVAWSLWLAMLLVAYSRNSRGLLRVAIWAGIALPILVLLLVVPLGVALSD